MKCSVEFTGKDNDQDWKSFSKNTATQKFLVPSNSNVSWDPLLFGKEQACMGEVRYQNRGHWRSHVFLKGFLGILNNEINNLLMNEYNSKVFSLPAQQYTIDEIFAGNHKPIIGYNSDPSSFEAAFNLNGKFPTASGDCRHSCGEALRRHGRSVSTASLNT